MPNYPALVFYIWHDSLHWRQSFTPNFSVHPVGKTRRWIEKWSPSLLMVSTSCITIYSLGKIDLREPAVDAKIWWYHTICYQQDAAKRQTAGIKITHRPKIRVFAPQGRVVAPIYVKLGMADGHVGPLGCAKFHLNRYRGCECGLQNTKKNPLFGKESSRRGEPLDRLQNFLGAFLHLTILQRFIFWRDSLLRLQSYCWETARRSIRPNFSVHL